MKLPNRKNAQVPKEKLLDYLLSESHPVGRSKAKFFRNNGFNETNVGKLEKALLSIALINEVDDRKETLYGVNYIIKGSMKSPSGKLIFIKTVWFIGSEEIVPRFVTAIPGIMSARKKA